MSISDIIEIIGILISLFTSLTAIVISVKSLKQNSKMIEESTRPYITIYYAATYFQDTQPFLIIKNFGTSAGTITKLKTDYDLKSISKEKAYRLFENVAGTRMSPGEMLKFPLNLVGVINEEPIRFLIEYSGTKRKYREEITINLSVYYKELHLRANSEKNEMRGIFYALQDISEKML